MVLFPVAMVMEGTYTCDGDTCCGNGAQGALHVPQQVTHELEVVFTPRGRQVCLGSELVGAGFPDLPQGWGQFG